MYHGGRGGLKHEHIFIYLHQRHSANIPFGGHGVHSTKEIQDGNQNLYTPKYVSVRSCPAIHENLRDPGIA